MPQRYIRRYSLPENQYIPGAPVLLAAGALLFDSETNKLLVQLKFQSLSDKNIASVTVSIEAADKDGKQLAGVDSYSYTARGASKGMTFGSDVPVFLPDALTASFCVVCESVLFTDGSSWQNDGSEWLAAPDTVIEEINQQKIQASIRKALLPAGLILAGTLYNPMQDFFGSQAYYYRYLLLTSPVSLLYLTQGVIVALVSFCLLLIALKQKWGKNKCRILGIATLTAFGAEFIIWLLVGPFLLDLLYCVCIPVLPIAYVIAVMRNLNPKKCWILLITALILSILPMSDVVYTLIFTGDIWALKRVLYTAGGLLCVFHIRTFQRTRR